MDWTWLGIAVAVFVVFSCYMGFRRGFVREVVSLFCVVLSMAVVWFINPYVNQFICENTSVCENLCPGNNAMNSCACPAYFEYSDFSINRCI